MDYIVDPTWVYWISVVDSVKDVLCVVGVFLVIFTIGNAVILFILWGDKGSENVVRRIIKVLRVSIPALICIAIASAFIPSQKTIITMKVAELSTKENIGWGIQQIKEIVDYIINAIERIK